METYLPFVRFENFRKFLAVPNFRRQGKRILKFFFQSGEREISVRSKSAPVDFENFSGI